jgi:5-methylcytosine-specific restriction endonuclease McrA
MSFAKTFYNSKLWKNARAEALHRDMFTCCECYGKAEEVHHIIPLSPDNIDNYDISLNIKNLRSLCHNCHTKITAGITGDVDSEYIFGEDGQVIKRE